MLPKMTRVSGMFCKAVTLQFVAILRKANRSPRKGNEGRAAMRGVQQRPRRYSSTREIATVSFFNPQAIRVNEH